MSSEKLTDYTVTLESNLAHYQKEPDSYSWKKQVDHLGPKRAQLIQKNKKNKWITWAPMGPRDSRAKEPKSLRQQHQGTRLPKAL